MLAAILVILLAPQDQPSGPWLLHRKALRGETAAVEMMLKLGADADSPTNMAEPRCTTQPSVETSKQ